MRIAIATQEDPFYLPPALEAFCRSRPGDVVAIIILPAFNEPLKATAGRLHEFYGTRDFARLLVRYVGANQDRLSPLSQREALKNVLGRRRR